MICKKDNCTGCGACVETCPFKCISLKKDKDNFYYPVVDDKKCKKCGLCSKICPAMNIISNNNFEHPKLFAVINKDEAVLSKSSSGGMFAVLAKYVIDNGGVVFASKFDANLKLVFDKAVCFDDIKQMMGSKYVQSFNPGIYNSIKNIIMNKQLVLFVGCPCQIAGLYAYLGKLKDSEYLITADLICHGVPSQDFFDKYIIENQKRNGSKIINFEFRCKDKGWKSNYYCKTQYSNGKVKYENSLFNPYMICFSERSNYRESCYSCKYASLPRIADFTLGDYFGVKNKIVSNKEYKNGVSAVVINNTKAYELFNSISDNVLFVSDDLNSLITTNDNLVSPSKRPAIRNTILKDEQSVYDFYKKYFKIRYKSYFVGLLPRTIKDKINIISNIRRKKCHKRNN